MRIIATFRSLKKDADGDWVVDFMDTPIITVSETLRERSDTVKRIARAKGWTTLEVENALDSGESVHVTGKFHSTEYRYSH